MTSAGPAPKVELTKLDELSIQDVTRRHESLVQLIYHNDRKAVQLVAMYFGLALAAVSATIALTKLDGIPRAWLLTGAACAVSFTAGGWFAYRAQWTADINLTGRKPDFWEWARCGEVDQHDIVNEYLSSARKNIETNESLNTQISGWLQAAYFVGAATPLFAGLVFLCASHFG